MWLSGSADGIAREFRGALLLWPAADGNAYQIEAIPDAGPASVHPSALRDEQWASNGGSLAVPFHCD